MTTQHPCWQLLLARVRESYREPAVLFWVYGFPLFLATGLGLAFSGGEPTMPEIAVQETGAIAIEQSVDESETVRLAQQLRSAGFTVQVGTAVQCQERFRQGKAALVVVPAGDAYRYVYDPNRPGSLLARYRVDDVVQRWKAGRAWQTQDSIRQEPGSRYIDFLIPGLMGLNLMGGGLWGVGFVLVDMRVRKLLKRLLATPMQPRAFLLSILTSRLVFIVPEMLALLLAGWFLFGVPMRGNFLTLLLVIFVGGAAFAGLGLLLGCRAEHTETVSGLINLIMLPMWMLSGTFFSSHRFPELVQAFVPLLPLTQLNEALRGVMLEGASLPSVLLPLLILASWAIVSFSVAWKCFRWY